MLSIEQSKKSEREQDRNYIVESKNYFFWKIKLNMVKIKIWAFLSVFHRHISEFASILFLFINQIHDECSYSAWIWIW